MAVRISIGGTFEHSDFDLCLSEPTLVLCDIEGAEEALLDPLKAQGLKAADNLSRCMIALMTAFRKK